jgi:hypothetical protein
MLHLLKNLFRPSIARGPFGEPWQVAFGSYMEEAPRWLTMSAENHYIITEDVPPELQRRIVACVNFCRNIDTETLERLAPPENAGAAEY